MKYILIALLACGPVLSYAQDCKYDKDEFDKFSKIRKLEKEVKLTGTDFGGNKKLLVKLCKYDTSVFFRIRLTYGSSMVVGTSDKFIFLLDNGETITAYPMQTYMSESRGVSSYAGETLYASYDFEHESDMEKLKSSPVKSIRVYFNSVYTDIDAKSKLALDLVNAAKCF